MASLSYGNTDGWVGAGHTSWAQSWETKKALATGYSRDPQPLPISPPSVF